MDAEIDLRPYLAAFIRRLRLITAVALICALAGSFVAAFLPQSSRAHSTFLIIPSTNQVTLDPRFVTNDAARLTNVTFQREALIGLLTSDAIAARAQAELPQFAAVSPNVLRDRVEVEPEGDLIKITVSAENDADALALAEAWGRAYEQLVAEVYQRDTVGQAEITEQITAAQARYDAAQSQLEQFLGQTDLVALEQRIQRVEGVLNGSNESGSMGYTQLLSRTQELDLILSDARALQAVVNSDQSDQLANRLSALNLRLRVVGSTMDAGAPEVQISDPAALVADPAAAQADLARLITALEQQRDALQVEAAAMADAIARGDTASIGLDAGTRRSYETELTLLRQQVEQFAGRQQALQQSRDIAFSSLEILQRKFEEQQIAEVSPLASVLYLSSTPAEPTGLLSRIVVLGGLGLVAGVVCGSGIALYLELFRRRPQPVAPNQPLPGSAPGD